MGKIVNAQVPDATESENNISGESTTDSELAPGADVTSTGAAELISSIISAIDDVDVADADETTGPHNEDPVATTDATKALINEVLTENSAAGDNSLSESRPDSEDEATVSVSATTDVTGSGGNQSEEGPKDVAY